MFSVALVVEATLREHVHDTFDKTLRKTAMMPLSLPSHCSLLLKWRSRVREMERHREGEREREKEKENIKKL